MKHILASTLLFCIQHLAFGQSVVDVIDRKKLPQSVYDSLKSERIILVGEIHGTKEAPEYVEGLVKLFVKNQKTVALLLEIPEGEQKNINEYLGSGEFGTIEKMSFFRRKVQDGRSSIAMSNLLRNLYGLKNLQVFCIDPDNQTYPSSKDSAMADNVAFLAKSHPGSTVICYTGNAHSKLTPGQNTWGILDSMPDFSKLDPEKAEELKERLSSALQFKPMGYFLARNKLLSQAGIASINIVFQTGTFWACADTSGRCGVQVAKADSRWENFSRYDNFFYKQPLYKTAMGFTAVLHSTYISASPPLVGQ